METIEERRKRLREYMKAYRLTPTGQASIRTYRTSAAGKETDRRQELKKAYGMTVEQYEDMLEAQNYGCAICGLAPDKRRLAVDHDHATGAIRALLCAKHNVMIGVLESPDRAKLEAYLLHHTP